MNTNQHSTERDWVRSTSRSTHEPSTRSAENMSCLFECSFVVTSKVRTGVSGCRLHALPSSVSMWTSSLKLGVHTAKHFVEDDAAIAPDF